jgi:hypothetical protein
MILRHGLFVACVLALAGCGFPMQGLRVHRTGLADTRPATTIGPSESVGSPPWQTFSVEVPSAFARLLVRADSTFHLHVTDCEHDGDPISIEDVYVNGVPLNRPHASLRGDGPTTTGVTYVSRALLKSHRELCFQAMGGNMVGLAFNSNIARVAN